MSSTINSYSHSTTRPAASTEATETPASKPTPKPASAETSVAPARPPEGPPPKGVSLFAYFNPEQLPPDLLRARTAPLPDLEPDEIVDPAALRRHGFPTDPDGDGKPNEAVAVDFNRDGVADSIRYDNREDPSRRQLAVKVPDGRVLTKVQDSGSSVGYTSIRALDGSQHLLGDIPSQRLKMPSFHHPPFEVVGEARLDKNGKALSTTGRHTIVPRPEFEYFALKDFAFEGTIAYSGDSPSHAKGTATSAGKSVSVDGPIRMNADVPSLNFGTADGSTAVFTRDGVSVRPTSDILGA